MAVLAILSFVTLQNVVAPAFDRLETEEAHTNLNRAQNAIQSDLENLSSTVGDWALWDDAYDYLLGDYPAFEDSNLNRPSLTILNLNLLAIFDAKGKLIWGQAENNGAEATIGALQIFNPASESAEYLITHTEEASHTDGLVNTGIGPMLISSWPVVRSDGSGPIAGTMIMGRSLDEARMLQLQERTEVQLSWRPIELIASGARSESAYEIPLNTDPAGTMFHEANDTDV